MFQRLVVLLFATATLVPAAAHAQERFSFFQASTPESVEQLLTLARLRDTDVVVDLGSGDGLIPLTAARMNRQLTGWGVDVNARLVAESNARAASEGLADRVRFFHLNAFDADLKDATVVTMWLFPELMRLLRPVILERARPGTRVLTSTWNIGDAWQPDETSRNGTPIYMWIVPARVQGGWEWDLPLGSTPVPYSVVLDQAFQKVEGVARAGDRREVLESVTLRGDDLSFTLNITVPGHDLTEHVFAGKVRDDVIEGTVTVTSANRTVTTLPWRARRTTRPSYFEPTGTAMFDSVTATP